MKNKFEAETKDELKDKLFSQDKRLIEAANRLATIIRSVPLDPKYPETEPRALIVGGFVRDAILGLHPKDIDTEVYGISADRLEDLLNQLFPGKVNAVGRAFGILKIHLADDVEFDISIPRHESKTGKGHRGFSVTGDPGISITDAARRRDFTINAMAADPLTGEIIDPFHGLEDLRTHSLRVTDPERFQDDPLRVYRALQFAARMELTVEPESKRLMQEMVKRGDLEELAKERVADEFKKLLLKAKKPSIGFELARELGIIEKYFPELNALIGTEQDPKWHPEGDVWTHTMQTVDQAAKLIREPERNFNETEKLQVMLGSLCHDLGKPATTKTIDRRIRSLGHETAGEKPARDFCDRLAFSEAVKAGVLVITTLHLEPGELYKKKQRHELDDEQYANAIRRLIKRIHPVSWRVLIAGSETDSRGKNTEGAKTEPYLPGLLLEATVENKKLDEEPMKPLLQGRDLITLGVKPGPLMGKIVRKIEELRDKGAIKSKNEAIDRAREILERP
ncbi:MAG: HD domain-containing protein [Patescibacteria group bacterium]